MKTTTVVRISRFFTKRAVNDRGNPMARLLATNGDEHWKEGGKEDEVDDKE